METTNNNIINLNNDLIYEQFNNPIYKNNIDDNDKKIALKKNTYINKKNQVIIYLYNIKDYNDNYYINNKDNILKIFKCECNGHYSILHRARHFKTNKHMNYINKNKIVDDENKNENLTL